MGWLLSLQLSDPGVGVCWAVSMLACGVALGVGVWNSLQLVNISFTWLVRDASACRRLGELRASPHVIGYVVGALEVRKAESASIRRN